MKLENRLGVTLYNKEIFYPCDRKKECFGSPICGKQCRYTRDIKHWLVGTKPITKMAAPEIFRR